MKLKFVFEKKSIHLKAMTKGYERLKIRSFTRTISKKIYFYRV